MAGRKRFVSFDYDTLSSEKFLALSANAKALLLGMALRFNGANNGEIVFSNREAQQWMHKGSHTATLAFRELVEAGFIELVERGAFSVKKGPRRASTWRLNCLYAGQKSS